MSLGVPSTGLTRAFTRRHPRSHHHPRQVQQHTWRDYALIALPYAWMTLFFLVPFLIIFKISFSVTEIAIPPYSPLVTLQDDVMQIILHLENYTNIFTDPDGTYWRSYVKSVGVACVSTLLCLVIGYPLAWAMATSTPAVRNVVFMLVIMPSWTSYVVRIYAWMSIMKRDGLLNDLLLCLGVFDQPVQILQTDFAVYVGMVYCYLPYMVLPLFAALMKVDYTLIEAAYDLGCTPVRAFFSSLLPQTKGGIVAGSMLVFIPTVGEYVIPELLGGKGSILIGRVLWQEFFNNRDWPLASAVAITMLLILVIPILWYYRIERQEQEEGRER